MKCEELLPLLEDYQYGELEGSVAGQMSLHLRDCTGCQERLEALEREVRLYDSYREQEDRELTLSPEVWRRVNRRIRQEVPDTSWGARLARFLSSPAALRPAAYVAVILFVALIGGIVLIRAVRDGGPDREMAALQAPPREAGPEDASSTTSFQEAMMAIQRAEKEYIEAIRILSEIAEKRRQSLDPELAARLERNLAAIDEAIASTRRAYRERPGDPELAVYMLHAYARKVELLQELSS